MCVALIIYILPTLLSQAACRAKTECYEDEMQQALGSPIAQSSLRWLLQSEFGSSPSSFWINFELHGLFGSKLLRLIQTVVLFQQAISSHGLSSWFVRTSHCSRLTTV